MNLNNSFIQEVKEIVRVKSSGTINDALPEHVFVHQVYHGNWDETLLSHILLCEMLVFAISILLDAVGLLCFS